MSPRDFTEQPDFHSLASVNLNIPRKDSTTPRPFRFLASDLEALIEVKPEGKVNKINVWSMVHFSTACPSRTRQS